ncbi:MAG: SdrD B-like domain-containing protein [Betaproteobacteria bacterium]
MRSIFAVIVVAFAMAAGVAPATAAEGVTISGTVFDDLDRNGVVGPGEPGRPSVTVNLDIGADGSVDTFTTTSASGSYSFLGSTGTTYRVRIVVPAGTVQNSANPADFMPIANVTGVDFALVPPLQSFAVPATSPAALAGIALLIALVGLRLFRSS